MAEEILQGIWQLHVPLPENPLKELNSYFIKGTRDGRNLLIDTGFNREECYQALRAELDALDVRMEETDILLTHMHSDHSGLAPRLATDDTRVLISAPDKNWLVEETHAPCREKTNAQYLHAGFSREALETINTSHPGRNLAPDKSFTRYDIIGEGDVLEAGGYALQVISVPGHTPGQIVLWDAQKKVLFSADHVLFNITPNITKWPDLNDSLGSYLENLKKIDVLPAEHTLPAHRMSGDLHERIASLLKHHEFRIGECLKIVQETPGLTAYDITGRMTWQIRAKDWASFPAPQRWFAVGECLSHLDYLMAREKVIAVRDGDVDRYEAA